jgi:hypothetical protein
MKKQALKKLKLNKSKVVKLENRAVTAVKGGTGFTIDCQPGTSAVTCNSVPIAEGGIGCHAF